MAFPEQVLSLTCPFLQMGCPGPLGEKVSDIQRSTPLPTPAVLQATPSLAPWTQISRPPWPWLRPRPYYFSCCHPGWCGVGTCKAPADAGSQVGGRGVLWLGLARSPEWHRGNRARDKRVAGGM